ncbi:MAG: class I SAM-dependent methyltransferase [Desulfovibrio sp.]|nr:class I SAM-dependent methyltransferase [Desulfovibrio sp.]
MSTSLAASTAQAEPSLHAAAAPDSQGHAVPCKVCGSHAALVFHRAGKRQRLLEAPFKPEGYERPYYRCSRCGLLFHTGFDHLTPEEEDQTKLPGVNNPKDQVINRAVRETLMTFNLMQMFKLPLTSRILIFGCGAGLSFNMMLGHQMNAYASDLTMQFPETAKRYEADIFNPELLPEMLRRFRPFDQIHPESVHLVTLTEVFEHFPNPVEMMQRIAATVRPGGLVIGTTGWVDQVREDLRDWWYLRCLSHCTFLSAKAFQHICRACGCLGVMLPGSPMITGQTGISPTQTVFVMQKPL